MPLLSSAPPSYEILGRGSRHPAGEGGVRTTKLHSLALRGGRKKRFYRRCGEGGGGIGKPTLSLSRLPTRLRLRRGGDQKEEIAPRSAYSTGYSLISGVDECVPKRKRSL